MFIVFRPACALFGGIRFVKSNMYYLLPDGTREANCDLGILRCYIANFYDCITAKSGWEWFKSAREEEGFKDYVKCTKELM